MRTFFSKKSKNSSEELSKQASLALSTFHAVLNSLKTINQQSSEKQIELTQEVSAIEVEIQALKTIQESNLKVISNIENLGIKI